MGKDKQLHILVSFIICIGIYIINRNLNESVMLTAIIGILKEVYDYIDYGLFSMGDLIADSIGVLIAIILILML